MKTTTNKSQIYWKVLYTKEKITHFASELSIVEKNRGQIHKFKAYGKAVRALKAHPSKITSGKEAEELQGRINPISISDISSIHQRQYLLHKFEGVGKKISAKIDEILKSGKLDKLERELEDETTKAVKTISQISGIGPTAAHKFVKEDGVRTLDDLRKIEHKLNHHQQIGISSSTNLNLIIISKFYSVKGLNTLMI